jgi:uncharacterized membrane protein YkvA (DUF1232 family)
VACGCVAFAVDFPGHSPRWPGPAALDAQGSVSDWADARWLFSSVALGSTSVTLCPAGASRRRPAAVMRAWLVGLGAALACLIASWGVLLVLARRLPPGILRDLAAFIPDCVTTVRRLRKDPRVPRRARVVVVIAGLWVASPIDLIPEFLPIIGPLDDIVVVALALRYAARQVPRDVLMAAWPGEPRLLERLLGPASTDATIPAAGVEDRQSTKDKGVP